MRFLLSSMVAATMLIAISTIGSKAEAAMMPSIGPLHFKRIAIRLSKRLVITDDSIAVAITAMATLLMGTATLLMGMAITDPITAMATGHTVTMAMGVAGGISLQEHPILSRVDSMSAGQVGDSSQSYFIGCRISDNPLRGTRLRLSPGSRVSS
jgi:hypothetical protein